MKLLSCLCGNSNIKKYGFRCGHQRVRCTGCGKTQSLGVFSTIGPRLEENSVIEAIKALRDGQTLRQIVKGTGLAKETISRISHLLNLEGVKCGCGQKRGHNGWCSFRYANSEARQAFHAGRSARAVASHGAVLFLGFMRNYDDSEIVDQLTCSVRGCPFPAKDQLCDYHLKFFAWSISMHDHAVDIRELFPDVDSGDEPVFFSGLPFELERDDFVFEYKGKRSYELAAPRASWPRDVNRDSYCLGEKH